MRAALLAGCLFAASGAYAAYPLVTEDTGTQGRGNWQLEATSEVATLQGGRVTSANLVLNYGLSESADLQLVLPWYSGELQGFGDPQVNVKWRLWERGPWSIGVKPSLILAGGDPDKGTGTGETNWAVTLIGGYESGNLSVNVDTLYQRNQNPFGARDSLRHISAGVLYQVGAVQLVADFTRETPLDPSVDEAARYNVLGAIWRLRPDFGVGIGYKEGRGGTDLKHSWLFGAALRW
ncbi:MAG TPA: transporter [Burkholderiales bacterium]|nr:transporter [Burkholderiales bacterium]